MYPPQPLLIDLPPEILTEIAFELSTLQPLGPPFVVLPLLLTCSRTYDVLSPSDNAPLWSRIFRYKFDSEAIQRRAFIPAAEQYVDQLVRYCRAMQVLRAADRYAGLGNVWDGLPDVGLEGALQTALLMMYEDDGKNSRQLLEWANLAPIVLRTIQSRSYEGSHMNNGWALETHFNACLLWLMWMTSSEESLRNLSEYERLHLINTLLPFVLFPYRYPVAEAPANYFHLPFLLLPDTTTPLTSTIQTAHGRYPVFPPSLRTFSEVHYSTSPTVTFPLVAPPAKLLYFALNEVTPVPIPGHLARTREEWLAKGNEGIAPTRDVLEEFNWGWYARLPLGQTRPIAGNGVENSWRWRWGLGDDTSPAMLFDESFFQDGPVGSPEGDSSRVVRRTARWDGKAPHTGSRRICSMTNMATSISKSTMWDADWWRIRLCGDPVRMPTRVPYGRMYEPGCMDGFWQGRMVTPGQSELEALLRDPMRPEEFTEDSLEVMFDFIFVRFREAHAVVGVDHGDDLGALLGREDRGDGMDGDGDDAEEGGDNMNNAWFAGEPGSTMFRIREGEGHGGGDNVEITVTDEWGSPKRGVFPCWKRERIGRVEGMGLGNDALGVDELACGPEEGGWWTGHEHDMLDCDECLGRRRVQRQLDRERAKEEARLTGQNSREAEVQNDEENEWTNDSDSSSVMSYDTSLDEWDPSYGFDIDLDGNEYPPLPPAHDRKKLAKGNCTGIKEIYLVGETPHRHGDAFNHFTYYGRVRMWDGLIAILRKPKHARDAHLGTVLFYGHLVGGENFVGNWRITSVDSGLPAWEGAFVMSRRRD